MIKMRKTRILIITEMKTVSIRKKLSGTGRANARPVLGFTYDIAKHIDKNYYLSVR